MSPPPDSNPVGDLVRREQDHAGSLLHAADDLDPAGRTVPDLDARRAGPSVHDGEDRPSDGITHDRTGGRDVVENEMEMRRVHEPSA